MKSMLKEYLTRIAISFSVSAFMGILINLIIDAVANATGSEGFISMSPQYVALFPTPVIAAYCNVLIYGLIGAVFSGATAIYEVERIGFVIQSLIYFLITAAASMGITVVLWQLHRYPAAFISTMAGYLATHIIMITIEYRKVKADIKAINELTE
ncbi:DUF3021 domain-containing protein [Butyrivibrio sp. AE2032]|jgi:Protein of unknown function (DUF3021).|uniref:DUF3021 domain-containing protein n=1 Tax=Butyrivibrio sp. AE2032 TaxID=1458463 RepID=UPI000557393D|nr:DUF3021 domain-containing protein [Butyrivibrio sp. AE2032]